METFGEIWKRIIAHEGDLFHTKTGVDFRYSVRGNSIDPGRNRLLPQSDFEWYFNRGRVEGPGEIRDDVQGSAYVWAIMEDMRIRPSHWR